MEEQTTHKSVIVIIVLVVIAAIGAGGWYWMHRVEPQPAALIEGELNHYFYASIEPEGAEGIPYWIWLVLPRIFPEYTPGPGGYSALGISWQEGTEMPVGFAKQRVGYLKVTGKCSLSHAISQPNGDQPPRIITAIPGQTTKLGPLIRFYRSCANDERFSASDILAEVDNATHLSLADRLLYKFVLIPRTREALQKRGAMVLFGPAILEHIRNPKTHVAALPKQAIVAPPDITCKMEPQKRGDYGSE